MTHVIITLQNTTRSPEIISSHRHNIARINRYPSHKHACRGTGSKSIEPLPHLMNGERHRFSKFQSLSCSVRIFFTAPHLFVQNTSFMHHLVNTVFIEKHSMERKDGGVLSWQLPTPNAKLYAQLWPIRVMLSNNALPQYTKNFMQTKSKRSWHIREAKWVCYGPLGSVRLKLWKQLRLADLSYTTCHGRAMFFNILDTWYAYKRCEHCRIGPESVISFYPRPNHQVRRTGMFSQVSHIQAFGAFRRSLSPKIQKGLYPAQCNGIQSVASCYYSYGAEPKLVTNRTGKQIKKRNSKKIDESTCCRVLVS